MQEASAQWKRAEWMCMEKSTEKTHRVWEVELKHWKRKRRIHISFCDCSETFWLVFFLGLVVGDTFGTWIIWEESSGTNARHLITSFQLFSPLSLKLLITWESGRTETYFCYTHYMGLKYIFFSPHFVPKKRQLIFPDLDFKGKVLTIVLLFCYHAQLILWDWGSSDV